SFGDAVNLKERIKPISYLKANTTEIVNGFDAGQDEPIIITQNGEAKMVVLSMHAYQEGKRQAQQMQEQHAFMKLIAMGNQDIARGDVVSEEDFLSSLDQA
ncbi:MAG: type II toxin-antitoxin system Phd/YefM family antitoxin, partial [Janthinobacterium sp.]